jgi:hypothetical protein
MGVVFPDCFRNVVPWQVTKNGHRSGGVGSEGALAQKGGGGAVSAVHGGGGQDGRGPAHSN